MAPHTSGDSFDGLGIAPKLLEIITNKGLTKPTPIQHQTIAPGIEGKDIVGIAQTGTGKTLAFSIPLIQNLAVNKGRGLILLPTRELALQVEETLRSVGGPIGLRTVVLIGGAPMRQQTQRLRQNPHVIVATPGRLVDHLEQRTVALDDIKVVVLDEADRMLDIGFAPQIKRILSLVPKERQTLLFSATMPPKVAAIASAFMKMPLRIEVAPAGTSSANVEQEIVVVPKQNKFKVLETILKDNNGSVLVFSRTKHGAKKIASDIRAVGHTAAEIHANRSLAQRRAALEGFKLGRFRVLVATDIAARGIDVKNISLVINYDLPDNPEDYVHRIGRTGRAGATGRAISFAAPSERGSVRDIERLIRKTLPILSIPGSNDPIVPQVRSSQTGQRVERTPMAERATNAMPDQRGNYAPRRQGSGRPRQHSSSFGQERRNSGGRPGGQFRRNGNKKFGRSGMTSGSASVQRSPLW